MEYSGLLAKFRTKRPLTPQERAEQLKQGHRLNIEPHYQLSVIKMNSTYLELVDKWFAWKGTWSLYVLCAGLILVGGLGRTAVAALNYGNSAQATAARAQSMSGSAIGMLVLAGVIALFLGWLLRKESFAYTHYPIRFNRKTRTVHGFHTDGTVFSASWDDIFFTLAHIPPWGESEVRGHLLEADQVTVRETFALSYCGSFDATDAVNAWPGPLSPEDYIRAHWEFIRRYMEEGPSAVTGQVEFCMPVDGRHESSRMGARRLFANIAGAPWGMMPVFLPLCAAVSLFRAFAMRTSRIPSWPAAVEAACLVETNDPYAITGDTDGKRIAAFPDAAREAGVDFVAPPRSAASVHHSHNAAGLRQGFKKK